MDLGHSSGLQCWSEEERWRGRAWSGCGKEPFLTVTGQKGILVVTGQERSKHLAPYHTTLEELKIYRSLQVSLKTAVQTPEAWDSTFSTLEADSYLNKEFKTQVIGWDHEQAAQKESDYIILLW